jgi:eukaryotic-like serine/threonine-protein kinase
VAVAENGEMAVIHKTSSAGMTLARLPLTGGPLRDVATEVADADWSRSGGDFAVIRFKESGRLEYPVGRVLAESTGSFQSPRISADGERVAYIEHPLIGDDRGSVVVIDREGRRITSSGGWASLDGIAWSADRREVWFTATRQGALCSLHAVDLAGRVRTITTAPGRLVLEDVAGDGRVLLSQELKRAEIYGRGPGDDEERPLSWHDFSFAADLSADGRTLLFSESGEAGGPGYGVYIRSTDGSPAVRLGEGRPFALSPDGAYALAIPLDPPSRITLLPTGAGPVRTLPIDPRLNVQFAGWLPDGDHLFVVASEAQADEPPTEDAAAGSLRVYEWDVEGKTPLRPLTPPRVMTMGRPFTPDGRLLLAAALDTVPATAKLYPVDGGDPRPVPHLEPTENVLGWNGDGSALYVCPPGRPRRIERLDLRTGRRQLLFEIRPKDPAGADDAGMVRISADGKSYVYNLHRTLSTLFVVEGLR